MRPPNSKHGQRFQSPVVPKMRNVEYGAGSRGRAQGHGHLWPVGQLSDMQARRDQRERGRDQRAIKRGAKNAAVLPSQIPRHSQTARSVNSAKTNMPVVETRRDDLPTILLASAPLASE